MCHNPLDWDKKLRGFFLVMLNASFSMFQPKWRTPPDRIVIDYPTHFRSTGGCLGPGDFRH